MTSSNNGNQDPMEQYTISVSTLHGKLNRVVTNQQAVAESLSRAAAALRSISQARKRK